MAKKFLIIQTSFIGDVILATPVIEKLSQHYPEAEIDFLLRKGNESLLANNPHLNEILVWNKKQNKLLHLFRLIQEVNNGNYDVVINLHRFASSGLITAFSGAKERMGFDKNPLALFYTKTIKHTIDPNDPVHEVDRNLSLIHHLTDQETIRPQLYPTPEDFDKIKPEGPYICIAPTSVWFTKQLPADKWVELMNRLDKALTVYLIGGPEDRKACEAIKTATQHPDVINLAGELSFLQSAALMKHAKMNYVNDSAPLHIASAMNAPVTAVFCSTVPEFGFGPLSDESKVVETEEVLSCRPCGLHGYKACPKGHFKCSHIKVEKLL